MIGVPLLFISLQFAGSDEIMLFIVAGPMSRASIIFGMYSVWGEFCAMGCVGSVCVVGCWIRGVVAVGVWEMLCVIGPVGSVSICI